MTIELDTHSTGQPGQPITMAPGVRRVTAPNGGPLTFHGTNSYLVGADRLVVVDPGPDDDAHLAALLAAIDGATVEAVLVTHTHRDHTGLTEKLRAATGAPVLAEGRHRPARPYFEGETNALEAAGDTGFRPDRILADGERLTLAGQRFEVVATPGHTANHLAFALPDDGLMFSGDHVMAWATTIVAPPDGSMADFMASLERLLARNDKRYLPGHGEPVENPAAFVRALRSHRRMREGAILEQLAAGETRVPQIVAALYRTTPRALHSAAALSVLAHLQDLHERGIVRADGPPLIGASFRRAD